MEMRQYELWIANLEPQFGAEIGKTRPVLIIQSNLLNDIPHTSTIVCPITTKLNPNAQFLRVKLAKGVGNIERDSEVVMDQIRSLDRKRFVSRIGDIPVEVIEKVERSLRVVMDL
jgi:mRNA interferase MazF